MTPVAELLRQLVRIPSVNPEGDPGISGTGERAIAEFLGDILKGQGAKVSLPEVLPGRPNVIGRFPSDREGKPRLLFAPHTDTVSVLGMTIDPFAAEIRDGRLWGRGASDTKGPMAAMLQALIDCAPLLPTLPYEVWFAGLVSEEAGQHGSRALAAEERFDFVIAGEPTELRTVHTHKGSFWLQLGATGLSCHASQPDRGRNAIEPVLQALLFLKEKLLASFAGLRDPILGSPTCSIGTIAGGSKVNIVPDRCEAWVDVRTLPGQDIASVLDEVCDRFPEVEISIKGSLPLYTDPGHPLVTQLADCGAPPVGAPWFCDAALFAERGMAAVALGPGSIAQAHTADEWIALDDLEAGVRFFAKFLHQLRSV